MNQELVNIIRRQINAGRTAGLSEKLDVFYLAGRISKEDYEALIAELSAKESREEI